MLVVFAAVALVVVFVIAAVVIGRESNRLSVEAPRPVFDLDEAVTSVADRVPFEVSAVLSHDDVRRMLRWNLADLQAAAATAEGVAGAAGTLPPSPLTVMGEDEAVAAVQARAEAEGCEYTDDQVRAVLDAHLTYLQLIGAVGQAEPDEADSGRKITGDLLVRGDTMSGPEKGGGPAEQTL